MALLACTSECNNPKPARSEMISRDARAGSAYTTNKPCLYKS